MRYFAPFVARCLLKAGFPVWCSRPGDENHLIQPGCETAALPALYEESDLTKITGVPTNTSLAWQLAKLSRSSTRQRSVYARTLRDVVMADGHLFRWNMVQPLAQNRLPKVAAVPGKVFDRAVLASTELGSKFFGHWLLDDLPLGQVASGLGPVVGADSESGRLSAHQVDYAKLFGSDTPLLRNAVFDELVIIDEQPEGPTKAAQYERMRGLIPRPGDARERPGVMILRKASGQMRMLWNELELADSLAALGFTIVDPMVSSVADIVDACWDARIVVGVEGSQLAHGFLPMRPGGTMFTLQPPFKFDLHWKDRCDCVGAKYAFVVGDPVEGGFKVDPHRVFAMLERISA